MRRPVSVSRHRLLDGAVVVAAITVAVEASARVEPASIDPLPAWTTGPLAALIVVPLMARRRFPFGAPVAVWAVAAAASFIDARFIVDGFGASAAGLAAAALLGQLRQPLRARLGLLVVVGCAATVVINDSNQVTGDFIFIPALFGAGWLAGYALAARTEQLESAQRQATIAEQQRQAATQIAVAEERARIARELHDVVGHAVSVMVLRVGAVRQHLPAGLDEDRDALTEVESTGRTALTEMRQLVAALHERGSRAERSPQPSLDRIEHLVDEVRRAGLAVTLHLEGDVTALPETLDLSAYRIVQEGLTNALKHAQAQHVDVTIQRNGDDLRLEVRDDGIGPIPNDGLGQGLVGIGERVKIFGGEMTAGASPSGGYVLRVELPTKGRAR